MGFFDWFPKIYSATLQASSSAGNLIARNLERKQQLALTRETNAQNERLMREGWKRDDSAITRMVKDAQNAGLSKFSVAGQGGMSSDPVSMSNPADSMDSSVASAFSDMQSHALDILQIQNAKVANEKAAAETQNIKDSNDRAAEEHALLMEKLGVDNEFQRQLRETEIKLSKAETRLREVEADVTKSKNERQKEIDFYETLIKALQFERDKKELEEDNATKFNPVFRGQRVANYRTELATSNANMVYENEINRQRASQAGINTKVARGKSDYEIAKSAYELDSLIKEVQGWDKKRKAELVKDWSTAIKEMANGIYLISEGVRKWVPIGQATEIVNTIGFQPNSF